MPSQKPEHAWEDSSIRLPITALKDYVKFRTDVILADRDTGELFSDKMRQIFLALPVFGKEENECENEYAD